MSADINIQTASPDSLTSDRPGSLVFHGDAVAELFTRQVATSMRGVLTHTYRYDSSVFMPGFVTASMDGRAWGREMWTRDTGTLLREFALWGWFNHGGLTCDCLTRLVQKNEQGFYTFPEWFSVQPKAGNELDGTCAIIIGMALLWRGLAKDSSFHGLIEEFLFSPASPLNYMHHHLQDHPFLSGEGEFGGGMKKPGYSVVQNHLARYALVTAARLATALHRPADAMRWNAAAQKLHANIRRHMIGPDGGWLWVIDPVTLTPPSGWEQSENRNHGGHNAPGAMYADALGLTPLQDDPLMAAPMLQTFDNMLAAPPRRELFEGYGFWSQFDSLWNGLWLTGAYGQGYALQCMLLFDRLAMADKALRYYAETTAHVPGDGGVLRRESTDHFVERYYLNANGIANPDFDPGCGELNLVAVTEPVKVARLMMGLDDLSTPGVVCHVPRLPASIHGYSARQWPISTPTGMARADIDVERTSQGLSVKVVLLEGAIPRLRLRSSTLAWREFACSVGKPLDVMLT